MLKDELKDVFVVVTDLDENGDSIPAGVFESLEKAHEAVKNIDPKNLTSLSMTPQIISKKGFIETDKVYLIEDPIKLNRMWPWRDNW